MRSTQRVSLTVMVAAGALLLGGCALGQPQLTDAANHAVRSRAHISLTSLRANGHGLVLPGEPVVVQVADGRLTNVAVVGPDGAVSGSLSANSLTWSSNSTSLQYGATYQITAAAVDRTGIGTTFKKSVTTVTPSDFVSADVTPRSGDVVGVGYPATVTLSRNIDDARKAVIIKHLVVQINGVVGNGAWRWQSDSIIEYRTPTYFPANSTIVVSANLRGVYIGHSTWGDSNSTTTYRTGDAMVSYVNMTTHKMTVTKNGKQLLVIPVTTGKTGFESRSGIKVILTKETKRFMDAATGGTAKTSANYYALWVFNAMRLTWSGEFLHAAPWSVAAQGNTNVSHGCTGMSSANAALLFSQSNIGDVVVYTGSDRHMTLDNGIGVWNLTWQQWLTTAGLSTLGYNVGVASA